MNLDVKVININEYGKTLIYGIYDVENHFFLDVQTDKVDSNEKI